MAEPVIHIHEDDWGMRTLHPLAAEAEVLRDMAASAAAAERNSIPGGGWTDVHATEAPSATYAEAGLRLEDAAFALEPILPRVHRFYADTSAAAEGREDPLGGYEEEAWCYGIHRDCFVKLEPRDALVEDVWFGFWGADPGAAALLRRAFLAIDRLVPSLVADHFLRLAGRIGEAGFLNSYFEAHRRQAEEAEKRWAKFAAQRQASD